MGCLAKELFPNSVDIEFDANNFNSIITNIKNLFC